MTTLLPGQLSKAANTTTLPITIVGLGGTGSRVAEGLVRIGWGQVNCPITLIDGDEFVNHNITNQLMEVADSGTTKVTTVAQKLRRIRPGLVLYEEPDYIETSGLLPPPNFTGVVFLCLDSMEVRKYLMEHALENNPDVHCVIDPRLDSGVGISHCFDPNNEKHQDCWWLYWHPDDEAENVAGCAGEQPVVSSIFGTVALALKQFEHFVDIGSAEGVPNRVYYDFDRFEGSKEVWPT